MEIKPKQIETVVEGATYIVPVYRITNDGLELYVNRPISFVKGAKDNPDIYRQEGYMTETLLQVCKQYLEDVSKGDLRDDDTQSAVFAIGAALIALERRQQKRKAQGVAQTMKPHAEN